MNEPQMPSGGKVMDVDRRALSKELRKRIEIGKASISTTDEVVDSVIDLLREHVSRGDKLLISDELEIARKYERKDMKSYRSGRRRSSRHSNKESEHYSAKYYENELFMMFKNSDYFFRKIFYFTRNTFVVLGLVLMYYAVLVLAGC